MTKENQKPTHWSAMKERGSMAGIQFLMLVYKLLGKRVFQFFFTPVITYFYITGGAARKATREYWQQITISRQQPPLTPWQLYFKGLRMFYSFGLSILDKFDAWLGKIDLKDIELDENAALDELTQAGGAVVLSTHLGNMEICRAIFSSGENKRKLNVITYNEHTPTFNNFLKKVNPEAAVNFIHINNFGPDDTIMLKQRIENGEVVVIFADRTSVNNPDSVEFVPFLSKPAPIAIGPFALATIMDCPVYFMACIKDSSSGRYRTYIEPFAKPQKVPRKERKQYFTQLMSRYADRLSHYCLQEPYQWYNFFDFWRANESDKDNSFESSNKTTRE